MSEYQYYEFAAVDRPLDAAARAELREVSSRARITTTSFVNSYEWGDLKADPIKLLERHFDLFLYVANWGTHRFALRVPDRFLPQDEIGRFGLEEDLVTFHPAGQNVIIDICPDREADDYEWDDGSGWLGTLSPIRSALIGGDLRLFSLLWLIQVDFGWVDDEAVEPSPGVTPLDAALSGLAEFFGLDPDLLQVAAEAPVGHAEETPATFETAIRALPEEEKVALLLRLHAGDDPHLGAELRRRFRDAAGARLPAPGGRTAGELREAARRIADERERVAAERAEAERRCKEREAARARAEHLATLASRGETAWRQVEALIGDRNNRSYDRAAGMIADLGEIAAAAGDGDAFGRRVADLRERHRAKYRFIERLDAYGRASG